MTDITLIVEGALFLLGLIWTIIVAPFIKSKTNTQQQQEINGWVKIAVAAAEQIYKGSGRGKEKKTYVVTWLEEHDIILEEERIDAMIEAAVFEINQGIIPTQGLNPGLPHCR